MHILIGDSRGALHKELWERHGWGRMVVDRRPKPFPDEPWALDNGAFRGVTDDFRSFERRLAEIECRIHWGTLKRPLFVVAPDVPRKGSESLIKSARWLSHRSREARPEPSCPALPLALAIQDDTPEILARALLTQFQTLFLAGSDALKQEAPRWAEIARDSGVPLHYARASTPTHVRRARAIGAHSLDTTWPLRGPQHREEFRRALEE